MYLPGKVNFSSSSHPIWLSLPCPVYRIILPLIENYLSLETQTSVNILQNFFNVNLCVHFVSMCLKDLKNGHRLTLKSLFIHPPCCINNRGMFLPSPTGRKLFFGLKWTTIRLFYSGAMALFLPQLKDICLFCFIGCFSGGTNSPSMISQLKICTFWG